MRRSALAILTVLLFPLTLGAAAVQQPTPNATVHGRVLDSSRAPVPGARVTARSSARRTVASTVTDARGDFTLALDRPAETITISADGFLSLSERIADASGAAEPREFVLQIAGVLETVDVSAPSGYQNPVVDSATRTPTPLRDVPQAVSVITRSVIDDQRMSSIADVVRYVPGVGMAQGEGNRDTPIFRGSSSTSDFFVDGVRDDVQYFRDLYNVERIEAFKGPNAMIFGRGGVAGVINRVSRQAQWGASREIALQLGSYDNRRVTGDIGQALGRRAAVRVTGVYENSDSYRRRVGLERYGINPTVAFSFGPDTILRAGYEHFRDDRTADRGIPSFQGRPVATDPSTFFGNAAASNAEVTVNVVSAVLDHRFNKQIGLRSRVSYGDYDKFYQNVFPGAVTADGGSVSLSAYNNGTVRTNLFNQTDLTMMLRTGGIQHTILSGVELGRQVTDNRRLTGFFPSLGPAATTVLAPIDNPVTTLPVEFRAAASDADNHGVATVGAVYAQDQIAFSRHVRAIVGLRYDRFEVDFHNNRTAGDFASRDNLLSPRASLVYKPVDAVSLYGSFTKAYLPRAGEQLSSLQLSNQSLDPEEFRNYEIGAKWDLPRAVSLTGAVYRLDRGNVSIPDPIDPTRSLLVDAQRSKGLEIGVAGQLTRAWTLVGGYAHQDGEITRSLSATAQAGARLAQLPAHSFSLWNKYDFSSKWSAGLGVISRSAIFASTDNAVVLPGFTRVDAAAYYTIRPHVRAQLNVENLLDADYYASAHSNTNITPGSPRAIRLALTTRF